MCDGNGRGLAGEQESKTEDRLTTIGLCREGSEEQACRKIHRLNRRAQATDTLRRPQASSKHPKGQCDSLLLSVQRAARGDGSSGASSWCF